MVELTNTDVMTNEVPKKEYAVTEERQKLIDAITVVYGECFKFSKDYLVGQALKNKFESVEKTMRKYRQIQEKKLEIARKELGVYEAKYKEAVRAFEKMSLEELDPSKYDELVAPVEEKYQQLFKITSNLSAVIQNVKMLTSKIFAKDKTQTMSMTHAHALYLTLKLVTTFVREGSVNVNDEKFNAVVLPKLEYIKDNYSNIFGEFNNTSSIDDIVAFLHPIAEHSADQAATRSRKNKDHAFKCIDDLCQKYNVEVVKPDRTDNTNDMEYELLVAGNQIKALNVLVKGKPVKRADGEYSKYPTSQKDKAEIVETIREASFYLNGITTIMSEEFISQLPLRDDSIKKIYLSDVPRLTRVLLDTKDDDNNLTVYKLLISHVLMSLSIVDQIPTLMLYI